MSKKPLPFEYIVVHCTATFASMTEVDAAWVDRVHRQRGFTNGTGYAEVITRSGHRQNHAGGFKTRPLWMQGAHVGDCGSGWNAKALGISLAGGLDRHGEPEDNFLEPQIDALKEAVAEYQALFDIPNSKVIGHRDLIKMTGATPKACPCFSTQEKLFNAERFGGTFKAPTTGSSRSPLRVPHRYEVKAGDSFWSIAKAYGVSFKDLMEINRGVTPENLQVGQTIRLL